jgi:hypothetical protein
MFFIYCVFPVSITSNCQVSGHDFVAYRPVAKLQLCKQRPFLSNARNNRRAVFSVDRATAIFGQRCGKHVPTATDINATVEERCFLCYPYRDVISKGQS